MQENKRVVIAKRSVWTYYLWGFSIFFIIGFAALQIYKFKTSSLIYNVISLGLFIYSLYCLITIPSEMIVYENGRLIISPSRHEKIEILPAQIEYVTHRNSGRWWHGFGTVKLYVSGKEIKLRQVADIEGVTQDIQILKNGGSI